MEIHRDGIHLNLSDTLAYPWTVTDNIFVRGYAYLGDCLLTGPLFAQHFESCGSMEDVIAEFEKLNGSYNVIVLCDNKLIACVDPVRSMPLFYREAAEQLELFDSLQTAPVSSEMVDADVLHLYKNALFTVGNRTLLRNTFQIPSGHYLLWSQNSTRLQPYFVFRYDTDQIDSLNCAVSRLDESYTQTFQRVIQLLNGRTAVIPLSGGHDSRLIAFYLKNLGYEHIIAYSYGVPGNSESEISKQVAETLDIPWYFIKYDSHGMRKLFQREYREFALQAGNCSSVPCLQEWYAIYQLKKRGILDDTCVIIPGYSGDYLAGTHLLSGSSKKETYSSEEIKNYLISKYFHELLEPISGSSPFLNSELEQAFSCLGDPDRSFTLTEANEIVESFDLDNRQAKFIENAVRVYDYFGFQWITPFFERAQFQTWSTIDNSLRYDRKAFFALEETLYPASLLSIPYAGPHVESLLIRRAKQIIYGPSYAHYIYGYFHLELHDYMDFINKRAKGVNVYAQEHYLSYLLMDDNKD